MRVGLIAFQPIVMRGLKWVTCVRLFTHIGVAIEPLKRRDYELSRHSSSGNDLCEVYATIIR